MPLHASLASPSGDAGSSAVISQNAMPSVLSSSTPLRCTTAGTSIVPLVPLVQSLGAWLALPNPSLWLIHTIRLGYAIQFTRRPPKFSGILKTSVAVRDAPVLHEEIAVILAKDAIEPVPPAEMKQGFYSPYFIVPKKGGGIRPILDLQVLNRALHKLPFKMLKQKHIIRCIQPQDWFAAVDLKDAYFHISILPRHRPSFGFKGREWQYRVLPFGLSLSPRVFTKVTVVTLAPLREVAIRILNCLEHGPLARTVVRSQGPGAPAPQPVGASGQLGIEQALPRAEKHFSQYGVKLGECGGASHQRACPVHAELPEFLQRQDGGTTETLSEAPVANGIRSRSLAARIASYEIT